MEKRYDIKAVEEKRAKILSESDLIKNDVNSLKEPFCVMMPPPNVTGSLHMGHALNYTLQDIFVRYARMQGKDVLWQPGTDHAGIATQIMVERDLAKRNIDKNKIGREQFLQHVWQWKEKYGNRIVQQQQRMGISANWEKSRFTLDQKMNVAVTKVFVSLYEKGLIYQSHRMVNWDPSLQTALSDLETEHKETQGHYYYLKYYFANDNTKTSNTQNSNKNCNDSNSPYIEIATTRPETLFGDVAVAVNPKDPRYQDFIGKKVLVPIINKEIPIIADDYADMEKGSGAVKITPAHDFNDFLVGQRHNLTPINIMDENANLNNNAPIEYRAMERFVVRRKLVNDLEQQGILIKSEKILHQVICGDRSGVILEPMLTKQWFVDAKQLVDPAIEAVKSGKIEFTPKFWDRTYFQWLNNIEPWCISRQLWWGHRIPVWYGPDGHAFVAENKEHAEQKAKIHYKRSDVPLTQDEDVLDTWFSSALWPFSTLGWPEKTHMLKKYYPSNILVTGFDIIFFWVARMIMMGYECMNDIPFKKIFINSIVKDSKGKKMSKSKGNVIDPLDIIEEYGSDALRFSLISTSTPSVDMHFNTQTVVGCRNFATKIWNAARFLEHTIAKYLNNSDNSKKRLNEILSLEESFVPDSANNPINLWIISKVRHLGLETEQHIKDNRLDLAAQMIYQFAWHDFCDWYLEFTKILINPDSNHNVLNNNKGLTFETVMTFIYTFKYLLKLMHPFMPFITDEIFQELFLQEKNEKFSLMQDPWPQNNNIHKLYLKEMDNFISLIKKIRSLRGILNIKSKTHLKACISSTNSNNSDIMAIAQQLKLPLEKMAQLDNISFDIITFENQVQDFDIIKVFSSELLITILLPEDVELAKCKHKLEQQLQKHENEYKKIKTRLEDPEFKEKAPKPVIEKITQQLSELSKKTSHFKEIIKTLT